MAIQNSIATLVGWATSHGATLHPSIEVYQDAQTGLSFRVKPSAKSPVQPYEPIVQLPTSLTLSYFNAVSEQGTSSPNAFPNDFLAGAAPHVVGRLFLIKEYLKGDKSFWHPYIQALPQPGEASRADWALAPFWPNDEAELLEGTNVEVGIDKIRNDVKRDLKQARELLCLHGAGDADAEAFNKALTTELYQWAYCIFSSRSFRPSLVLSEKQQRLLPPGVGMDDFSVLLPLFDIGNHDMTTEIRWDLDNDQQHCSLKVGRTHKPGQQVFNNYSMKTNAELLLGYGFMLPATKELHNDYTHVRKRTTTAPQASEEYLISLRPLSHPSSILGRSKQSLTLDPSTKVLGSFKHVQPEMVWDIFCTLTTPEQRGVLIPVPEGAASEKYQRDRFFSGRVDGEARMFLQQTVAIIQHKVLQELERLSETDVEVVGGDEGDLTRNQRLALDYRGRCRKVLEGVLESMSGDEIFDDDYE
ncbi:SET domain-containing protein [Pochonia chlamydosporia 170]|uniref:SET domain-containing protein n=1 Tax=Pochonia chlamydosporia 170 TaxID=1380566 RepID=A0A179FZI3_METCM|nr:SET domain-containing protein [Pochonia chlamydosporia 170]OAQ71022.1 SET domain-containing protein [Pochonia chlamydosporia 170]